MGRCGQQGFEWPSKRPFSLPNFCQCRLTLHVFRNIRLPHCQTHQNAGLAGCKMQLLHTYRTEQFGTPNNMQVNAYHSCTRNVCIPPSHSSSGSFYVELAQHRYIQVDIYISGLSLMITSNGTPWTTEMHLKESSTRVFKTSESVARL